MKISADTHQLKDLGIDFRNAPPVIERELRHEIKSSSHAVATHYRRHGRDHFVTGDFDASISADSSNGWLTGEIGSDILYSIFLEVGTKWHTITPKTAKVLAFFWDKLGINVFLKQVKHPGTPAYNLLLKAYIEVMEPFDRTFGERLRKSLEALPV